MIAVRACRCCRREVRRIDDSREHVLPFRILLDTDCRIRSWGIASLLVQSVGTLAPALTNIAVELNASQLASRVSSTSKQLKLNTEFADPDQLPFSSTATAFIDKE